jgi:hypothetical protein
LDSAVSSEPGVEGSAKRQVCASQNKYPSLQQNRGQRKQFFNSSAKYEITKLKNGKIYINNNGIICKSLFTCKKTSMCFSKYLFFTTTKPWPARQQFLNCGENEKLARKDNGRDWISYKV